MTQKDYGPYSLGRGRVRLYERGGYGTGEYGGPEGTVTIYSEGPNGVAGSHFEFGYVSMEYVYEGKEYRRVWERQFHRSWLPRLARQLIADVTQGYFSI